MYVRFYIDFSAFLLYSNLVTNELQINDIRIQYEYFGWTK